MSESVSQNFNHLKVHTQYSICEGAARIDDLQEYSKKNKIKSLGLCDTSNLCGALEFAEKISKSGTQPIIGWVPTLDIFSANSRAPHKFDVSHKARDLIFFSLDISFKSSILIAPSHIEN